MLHKTHVRSIASGVLVLAAIVGLTAFASYSQRASAATTINAGDLIRGTTFSAVYYVGADGFRYVFPNLKTFNTWYPDFSTVKWVSDADLGNIQIGGNVTYKPGSQMIKINTDPKTYYVGEGGNLYWVDSEATATLMYGANWNRRIDDVADSFFSNYTITGETADADMAAFTYTGLTINDDKNLVEPQVIEISDNGFHPVSVTISAGETVKFMHDDDFGDGKHTATGDNGRWGTGTLEVGDSFIVRFNEEGTYTFTDSYEGFTGAVFVE